MLLAADKRFLHQWPPFWDKHNPVSYSWSSSWHRVEESRLFQENVHLWWTASCNVTKQLLVQNKASVLLKRFDFENWRAGNHTNIRIYINFQVLLICVVINTILFCQIICCEN
jgi:hypothetical protein